MIVAVVIVVAAEVVIVVVVISNIYRMLTTYWQFPKRFKYFNNQVLTADLIRGYYHPHLPTLQIGKLRC